MAQSPQTMGQIYKKFTDSFAPTNNARDVVRFAKRRLSLTLKYSVVQKYLVDKSMHLSPYRSPATFRWSTLF